MTTAQIDLTDAQDEALRKLAQRTGKPEKQLLREAVERLLGPIASHCRQTLLQHGKGLWKDRTDLPDFAPLRAEMDRRS